MSKYVLWSMLVMACVACKKGPPANDPITVGDGYRVMLHTDKARYMPGETVQLAADRMPDEAMTVRYSHLGEVLKEHPLTDKHWSWQPPLTDYQGYLVELYSAAAGDGEQVHASIGVDVSSDWSRFPRYGFLSHFGDLPAESMAAVMENLNRHHINGIQFYDWHYKHHKPLAGTPDAPLHSWQDIIGRENRLQTVKGYIQLAKSYGMVSMSYNLGFGALADAPSSGVSDAWYLYKDGQRMEKDRHELPKPPFVSDIYLLNPANTEWQQYLSKQMGEVYEVFDFDGFHVDQLGDRGMLYDGSGTPVRLAHTYPALLASLKAAAPGKRLVMNAVNQYGQQGIAGSPVDMLYTEVWGPNESYNHLVDIIRMNDDYGDHRLPTVLAAYMNYDKAGSPGQFNTPAVLLTNAVIFSNGGTHIELGEHMLGKEYFPNNNLQMPESLKKALVAYYDFMVAYQNILRGAAAPYRPDVEEMGGTGTLSIGSIEQGKVAVSSMDWGTRHVLHFLNFTQATHLHWRDANGTQATPTELKDRTYRLGTARPVKRVWMASPDRAFGKAEQLPFDTTPTGISFRVPELLYWNMVVLEFND